MSQRERQETAFTRILNCNLIYAGPRDVTLKVPVREYRWWTGLLAEGEINSSQVHDMNWRNVVISWASAVALLNGVGSSDPQLHEALSFCKGRA